MVTNFLLAVGGALLAVSLTVGGVPPAFTLIGATVVLAGLAMAALVTRRWVFAVIFLILVALGVGAFVITHIEKWVKYPSSTWWTLVAVLGFAGFTMALGTIHTKAKPPKPAVERQKV
jgi:hypothetical protein